ncbi:MAG: hypothetical protein IAF38_12865 [Bacteroidia bacterium]|nr:hypothetical protein [Bacteroidia bacterium]
MDVASHALVGVAIGLIEKNRTKKTILKTSFFSFLPDIFQLPYYLAVGNSKNRSFNWPQPEDWTGFRGTHPFLDTLWNVPHSIFFLLLVIIPIIKLSKQSNFLIIAYLSHILIDIPTHTGEWGVKFLFPFNLTVSGFTDAWAWSLNALIISWAVLFILSFCIYRFYSKTRKQNENADLND